MKKFISIISIILVMLMVISCGGKKGETSSDGKQGSNTKSSKVLWVKNTDDQGKIVYSITGQKGTYAKSSGEKGKLTYDWFIDENGVSTIVLYENGKSEDISTLESSIRVSTVLKAADGITASSIPAKVGSKDSIRNIITFSHDVRTSMAKATEYSASINCGDIEYDFGAVNTEGCEGVFFDSENYKKAIDLMSKEQYQEAIDVFNNLDTVSFDYFESQTKVMECKDKLLSVQDQDSKKK